MKAPIPLKLSSGCPTVRSRPPIIGYVDFPADTTPQPNLSVFTPGSSFVVNNNLNIILAETNNCQIYYTSGPTGGGIPDPSTNSSGPIQGGYHDGMAMSEAMAYAFQNQILPDLTIKAIGVKSDGSPPSAIVSARFQFITANPVITGNNAAQFTVSDITTNAQMWYTYGTANVPDPIPNSTNSLGPIASGQTLSLQFPAGQSNLIFKIIATNANYQASGVVPAVFSSTNYVPNSISFGFASGEASSDFVGSPGQTFYAPVTLSPLSGTIIYSLQFNLTVTNAGPNPGPAVTKGAYLPIHVGEAGPGTIRAITSRFLRRCSSPARPTRNRLFPRPPKSSNITMDGSSL